MHHAIPHVLSFLNAIRAKDNHVFSNYFSDKLIFRDVLPDGSKVDSGPQLVDMHAAFFQTTQTLFTPYTLTS